MTERVNKNSRLFRILILALAALIAFSSFAVQQGFADEEDDKQAKKEKELKKVQEEKDDVYEELNKLSKDIETQQAAIEKVKKSIDKKNSQIKKTEKSLKLMKKEISERKDGLDMRLRTMYKNGVVGYLDIILNSNDVTELITNVDMVQRIYKADQETLDTLVQERMQIEAQEATLKKEKSKLNNKETELADKEEVKTFDRIAKQYGVDYAIKKGTSPEGKKRYILFFKARDRSAIDQAMSEYALEFVKKHHREHPPVEQVLDPLKEMLPSRKKERVRDKGMQR